MCIRDSDATLQKRIGPLLEKNRIEWKKVTPTEALAIVGRGWKPDGGGGTSGGVTALKELTDKRRYSMGNLGRRRVNKKLGIDSDSLQMSADDLMAAVEYILNLPLSNGTTDNIDSLENRHLRGVDVYKRQVITLVRRNHATVDTVRLNCSIRVSKDVPLPLVAKRLDKLNSTS